LRGPELLLRPDQVRLGVPAERTATRPTLGLMSEVSGPGQQDRASALPAEEAPTTLRVCAVWARIGLQSFGGGQAVQLYAYRAFVQKRRWLTSAEWADAWGFCQLIPGINLLAFAALTGSRLVGTAGALAGVVGLLAPSVVVTILLAAGYARIGSGRLVASAIHGVVVAALGIVLLNSYRLIRPGLSKSRAEGPGVLAAAVGVCAGSAAMVLLGTTPIAYLLLGGGTVMAGAVSVASLFKRGVGAGPPSTS
jgi:chromate transporter